MGAAVIDAHVHVDIHNLLWWQRFGAEVAGDPRRRAAALQREMSEAGVTVALAMGRRPESNDDPLGIAGTLEVARFVPGVYPIGVADHTRTEPEFLRRVEQELAKGRVKALKAYVGYTPAGPDDPGYRRYYELAARYNLPVFIHTGDTPVPGSKVRFAHPLLVDDVAVDFPEVRFILAHFGNPWFADAAEVIYKNHNVWADLSGWLFGDRDFFAAPANARMLARLVDKVTDAIEYTEKPDRILFGTDWPIVPIKPYHDLVQRIVPEQFWPRVFTENARELFGLAEPGAAPAPADMERSHDL